ncbi:hypothetical protein SODALDRAFT_189370 [Sodiomyces alkalinus F11]|uniref:Zn(2)-C6 fungal-type domain-containing protein n=1 Tax=Sodiomyces alkalinus (strain CBS 110278 / VKM F-3762 / F11) TaxID=1314773 RepID=A0A3N2PRN3_SODAK|nr:hypothetical protein SODALDRAFT_189370 [Sodiomyces alkalinus F11]ROT37148.1 hypothetical protein SODALDRAFT_189370 [Sodiomyces alkalinus F11]
MESSSQSRKNAARRSHRKVRTGCKMCKTRKIKCDETMPQCQNCVRYGAKCDITERVSSLPHHRQTPDASAHDSDSAFSFNSPPAAPSGGPHAGPPSLNMLDLELLYHWSTTTSRTITEDPFIQEFWRSNAVQLALRRDHVMRGILALSALHLAQLCPSREAEFLHRSVVHHEGAARRAMTLMPLVESTQDQELADSLFVFSVLTMYYGQSPVSPLLSSSLLPQLNTPKAIANSEDPSGPILLVGTGDTAQDWMVLFKGVSHLATITKVGRDPNNILYPFINNARKRSRALQAPKPHPYLDLLRARLAATPLHPRLRAIYDHTVDQLHKQFSAFYLAPAPSSPPSSPALTPAPRPALTATADRRQNGDGGGGGVGVGGGGSLDRDILDIFIWVSSVSDNFMPLLRHAPSQETLAIFSYFCMLPKRLPRRWWLNRWADSLKIRTYELLDTEHRTWVVEPTTWADANKRNKASRSAESGIAT